MDIIHLDFMKAFGTDECLLCKISKYGIKDPLHGIIRSFLHNRSQCVMINGCISESVHVTIGIPKGSVLGSF